MSAAPSCSDNINRRQLILGGAGGAGLLLLGCGADSAGDSISESKTPWPLFVSQAEVLAYRAAKRGRADEYSHLAALAIVLSNAIVPLAEPSAFPDSPEQTILHHQTHLVVARYLVGPNKVIPAHDHRGYNGVMRVTRGFVTVSSYEMVESVAPAALGESDWSLRLKTGSQRRLGPSDIAAVTLGGANIHQIQAGPEGAEFVDVFTIYESPPRSREIELGRESRGLVAARFTT